jgi:hypothetical protein
VGASKRVVTVSTMRFLDACVIVKHFRLCVMGTWNGAGGERRV